MLDVPPKVPAKLLPFFKYVRKEADGTWAFIVQELPFDPCMACRYAEIDGGCSERCPSQISICLDPAKADEYVIAIVTHVVIGNVDT